MYTTYFRKKENIHIRNQRRNGLNNSTMKTFTGKQLTHLSLRATKNIKLQNFDYKFLMRIIPLNRFLLKFNIGHTTLCDFCCIEIETLDHLFWECIHVQLFWTYLSTLLQDYNVFIHFNLRNIMLGITEGTNQTEVQRKNFINLLHFKLYLKHRINIEKKNIYCKKDRLAQFNKKWGNLRTLME